MSLAKLRVCASCEWIFSVDDATKAECPQCTFGHYAAHYVYDNQAYRYAVTQKPWFDKQHDIHHQKLLKLFFEKQGVKGDVRRFSC